MFVTKVIADGFKVDHVKTLIFIKQLYYVHFGTPKTQ